MTTLFAMTVDAEEEWEWCDVWPTNGLSVTNIHALPRLQDLCKRHRVATTYFANQAVLDDPQARDTILDLSRDDRVEIGMHVHPWNTPPLDGIPVTTRTTFVHNLPAHLARAKLESVYGCFDRNGLRPTSFRGGRYSSGPTVRQFLRERGFLADASVVPFTTWTDEGAPDYRNRDLQPVRLPAQGDGEEPLWEIPLTLGFTRRPFGFWAKAYDFAGQTWLGKLRVVGAAEKLGLVRKAWLNFEDPLGRDMLSFLRVLRPMKLPCVTFCVHSSSLVAGKGPYTKTREDEDRLFATMEEVFQTLTGWEEFESATVTEVARRLEGDHARSGN